MASAASPLHAAGTGLIHENPDASCAIAFRGYVLPRLHSYSSSENILGYWQHRLWDEHNGVFSAAVVGQHGSTLTLVTDVLGIGTLYYRSMEEGAVIFSTNPRYLTTEDYRPDLLGWRSLLQTSWIIGNHTLTHGIKRVPAGSALHVTSEKMTVAPWFDLDQLPGGTTPAGRTAVGDVEECFQQAITRCLQLQTDGIVLPLSSGFDSRRILATLIQRKTDFHAVTHKSFQKQKGHRDLDARFAHAMAKEFGFSHRIVRAESHEQYVADDQARRLLVDGETYDHTWALRIMAVLPNRSSLFFDGIGGDILGDPVGWKAHLGLAVGGRSSEEEIEAIARNSITNVLDSILNPNQWPDVEALRIALKTYLEPYQSRQNIAELAFLLLRQRRGIALWSQQLLSPGHIAVCPYLDLSYLRLLLSFKSTDKHAIKFQRTCLKEFWPEFYKYPGTRDIPTDLPPGSPRSENERYLQCYLAMSDDIKSRDGMATLRSLLTTKGRLALAISEWNTGIGLRRFWYLGGLIELIWRHTMITPCWRTL